MLLSWPASVGAAEPIDEARQLPGLSLFRDKLVVTANVDGTSYSLSLTGAAGVSGTLFKSRAGTWHAVLGMGNRFALPANDLLGAPVLTAAVLALSPDGATDTFPCTDFPRDMPANLKNALCKNGSASLERGIRVVAEGQPGDRGAMGVLARAMGVTSVRVTGVVGPGVFAQALASAGLTLAQGMPTNQTVQVTIALGASITPPPFNDPKVAAIMQLTIANPELTFIKTASSTSLSGTLALAFRFGGKTTVTVPTLLSTSLAADGTVSLGLSTTQPVDIPDVGNAFGASDGRLGVTLRRLGLATTFTRTSAGVVSGDFAFTVVASFFGGADVTTTMAFATKPGGNRELSLAVSSLSVPVPSPANLGDVEQLTVENAKVGVQFGATTGLFVGADSVTWRALKLNGFLLYARTAPTAGVTVFLDMPQVKLSAVVAAAGATIPNLPAAVDTLLTFPSSVVVLSTIDLDDSKANLPSALSGFKAFASGGLPLPDDKLRVSRGLSLISSLDLAAMLPSDGSLDTALAKVGIPATGKLTIAGTISVANGQPSFSLYASLPTLKIPADFHFSVPTVTPRLFLGMAATKSGPRLAVGIEALLGNWNLDAAPSGRGIDLLFKAFVELSATSGFSLKMTGVLKTDWTAPFRMDGMTILKDTGLAFAISQDSGSILANGNVRFKGMFADDLNRSIDFGLSGGVSIVWTSPALGLPSLKAVLLRIDASNLNLPDVLAIGQAMLRNFVNLASDGANKLGLPAAITSALSKAKQSGFLTTDLVALIKSVLPTQMQAGFSEFASLKLKNAKLFIATPGMSGLAEEFPGLDDVGVRVAGDLYKGDTFLAGADIYATTNLGLQVKATTGPITMGPLSITAATGQTGPLIDIGAGIPGLQPTTPRFRISGKVALAGATLMEADVDLSASKASVSALLDLGCAPTMATAPIDPRKKYALYNVTQKRFLQLTDRKNGAGMFIPSGTDQTFGSALEIPMNWVTAGWQGFRIEPQGGMVVALHAYNDWYLRMPNGTSADSAGPQGSLPADWGWERFTLVDAGGGKIALKGAHNTFLHMRPDGSLDGAGSGTLPADRSGVEWRVVEVNRPAGAMCLGTTVRLSGEVKSLTDFSLSGSTAISPPTVGGVSLPALDASFTLGSSGVAFSGSVGWSGASFALSGTFSSPSNWSFSGSAAIRHVNINIVEAGTYIIGFETYDDRSKLEVTLSPQKGSLRAKLNASVWGPKPGIKTDSSCGGSTATGCMKYFDTPPLDLAVSANFEAEYTTPTFSSGGLSLPSRTFRFRIFP